MTINNATLSTIKSHRSIRKYNNKPISSEKLAHIILAAQSASSSSFMQCSSIIRITDQNIKSQFVTLTNNQEHVGKSAEFLIFCVDFYKHKAIVPEAKLGFAELTLIGAIDAGIMAQNALLAAESMGIGGVYIGAIRNKSRGGYSVAPLARASISFIRPMPGLSSGTARNETATSHLHGVT